MLLVLYLKSLCLAQDTKILPCDFFHKFHIFRFHMWIWSTLLFLL
jgi:hypothetical protein